MANRHHPCPECRKRHAPKNCRAGGGPASPGSAQGIPLQSIAILTENLARIFRELADVLERFPITPAEKDPGAAIPAKKNSGACPRSPDQVTDPSTA